MDIDRNGMVVLGRDECLLRLGRRGIGRVAVTVGALPAIFPINYAIHDGDVYFRTASGTKLATAARNAVVAFEVDEVDRLSHLGWSVQVVGPAATVEDADVRGDLAQLPLERWIGDSADTLVRIRSELVSGREITRGTDRGLPADRALPLTNCPDCGADTLVAVSDGELTNFVCTACFACWHYELGSIYRTPVVTCPGCRLSNVCRAAHAG